LSHEQAITDAAGVVTISPRWRVRLTYLAMSAFVAFHTLVMVIRPNPSTTAEWLRGMVRPYLSLLVLEGTWTFFAPTIDKDSQFRYVIEDENGHEHAFVPLKEVKWFLPSYEWVRALYYEVIKDPDRFGGYFAATACRQHASLHPISVMMIEVKEQSFLPEDYLNGKRPFDPEFLIENPLRRVDCQS
jgi:hypothetical protein